MTGAGGDEDALSGRFGDGRFGLGLRGGLLGLGVLCGRGGFTGLRQERGDVLAGGADDADGIETGDHVALGREDLEHGALDLRRFVKSALVGLIGEQDVSHGDRIAFLLLPRRDDAGLDALTLTGHDDYVCHGWVSFRL